MQLTSQVYLVDLRGVANGVYFTSFVPCLVVNEVRHWLLVT
jgi:hypothetical protein